MVINDWARGEIDKALDRYEKSAPGHANGITAAVAPILHDLQQARAEADVQVSEARAAEKVARLAYEENERDRMAAEDRLNAEIKALRDRLALAHAAVGALARMAVAS